MPSIVIDNVSRLGRVWREAEAEHSDVEARRPMARPGLAIAFPVAIGAKAPFSGFVRPELASSDLVERAKGCCQANGILWAGRSEVVVQRNASIRAARRLCLAKPRRRAKKAAFRWATGEPDFTFFVSFEIPDRVSIVAESLGDIVGLVLVGPHVPNISVETKPSLGNHELGHDALQFREILLTFPTSTARRLGPTFWTAPT